jgi:hypothetical protein
MQIKGFGKILYFIVLRQKQQQQQQQQQQQKQQQQPQTTIFLEKRQTFPYLKKIQTYLLILMLLFNIFYSNNINTIS